jgi:predicted dehydrogenase
MSNCRRFIQVGTGGFGAYWCNQVMPRLIDELKVAEAVAVVDVNPDTFADAMAKYHLAPGKCYTDAAKAFAENKADFVVIVVPPAFHEQVVDLALAHGMDILSEKPIADTMAACCRIYKKVKQAGRKMTVTMSHRFDQDKQSLEAAIKSGTYGPLNYVIHRFTHNCRTFASWGKFRHEIPDPLLIEGTVHHFDILRALTGADAKNVYAVTWNPPWGEYAGDSTGLITMEMENGVRCFYEGAKANASTMNGWGNDYIRAECKDGTLELDRRWLRVLRGGAWERPLAEDLPLRQQPVWVNPWLAELFVAWLNGGPVPPNNLDDNIQCAALLFAAIESAHTKQIVNVQDYLRKHLAAV